MSSNQIDFKLRPIRRVFWLAVGALALALPLFTSGCGPTAAATEFAPLAAGWPTPGFADATPTPTLFPRVTWAPGETPVVW